MITITIQFPPDEPYKESRWCRRELRKIRVKRRRVKQRWWRAGRRIGAAGHRARLLLRMLRHAWREDEMRAKRCATDATIETLALPTPDENTAADRPALP